VLQFLVFDLLANKHGKILSYCQNTKLGKPIDDIQLAHRFYHVGENKTVLLHKNERFELSSEVI